MCVCLFVCSLTTLQWVEQLSPNFHGSSRAPQGWFHLPKKFLGSWVGGQKYGIAALVTAQQAQAGSLTNAGAI